MKKDKKRIFLNTIFWGFALWFVGYMLGILLFAIVPATLIGWIIMPIGITITLWVLFKKNERESLKRYPTTFISGRSIVKT